MSTTAEKIVVTDQGVVLVTTETSGVVITGIMGPPGPSGTLSAMSDIDKTGLTDGATLVYSANNSIWKATNKLDNQILEAGQF
jgi:hypothetical protein